MVKTFVILFFSLHSISLALYTTPNPRAPPPPRRTLELVGLADLDIHFFPNSEVT